MAYPLRNDLSPAEPGQRNGDQDRGQPEMGVLILEIDQPPTESAAGKGLIAEGGRQGFDLLIGEAFLLPVLREVDDGHEGVQAPDEHLDGLVDPLPVNAEADIAGWSGFSSLPALQGRRDRLGCGLLLWPTSLFLTLLSPWLGELGDLWRLITDGGELGLIKHLGGLLGKEL